MRVRLSIISILILIVLTPTISSSNGYVGFSINIDNASPWSTEFIGSATINDYSEEFITYSKWHDNRNRLFTYILEWNLSGIYSNETQQPIVDGWANISKTFNSADEGKLVYYKIHASDTTLNWNSTVYKTITIASASPRYFDLSIDNESPVIGALVNISSYWTDNFEVDNIVLQTNETGSWHDNGSPINIDNLAGWGNFTIDTTGMTTEPYYWRLKGTDEIGNYNTTSEYYFTPQNE